MEARSTENAMDWDDALAEEEGFSTAEVQIAPGERVVFSITSDPSILDLYQQMIDGVLDVQPDFQREYVWTPTRASRLIESVLLSFPLPTIYLAEDSEDLRVVIDGQQRLTTFRHFMQGDLTLSGLESRVDLNGLRYQDLSRADQNKFKRFAVRTVTIQKESHKSIRFEMFHRINSGSQSLKDQELRNCVFRGLYNSLLKELATDRDFRAWFTPTSLKRMKDAELVLRFAAFQHTHYSRYENMRTFLNNEMSSNRNISENDSSELKSSFRKSVRLSKSLLGQHGFRRFRAGTEEEPNGSWGNSPNAAVYDIIMYGFSQYSQNQVYPYLDSIRESLIWLMTSDPEFISAIDNTTGSRPRVQTRFSKWLEALEGIVGTPADEPRRFTLTLKEQFFQQNPDCSICGSRIHQIEDAALDHIEQYWRGGRTIPENARLAHRYCNNARSRLE